MWIDVCSMLCVACGVVYVVQMCVVCCMCYNVCAGLCVVCRVLYDVCCVMCVL